MMSLDCILPSTSGPFALAEVCLGGPSRARGLVCVWRPRGAQTGLSTSFPAGMVATMSALRCVHTYLSQSLLSAAHTTSNVDVQQASLQTYSGQEDHHHGAVIAVVVSLILAHRLAMEQNLVLVEACASLLDGARVRKHTGFGCHPQASWTC
ncbi:hypothetical protein GGS23DRAFT_564632 [Durotheca rogersii]|uniref:uncharacterized protein n=1 Tax=Durotheca rogersii TaxID=419775 RepID=UPI00221FE664|nr:uncharacterized protein GGS23DRAFT_564632 [Durotheca rogersii]KAI5863622.1 hypothetical protein GGS23DRAFT_564632 [Durotheca rogersii]